MPGPECAAQFEFAVSKYSGQLVSCVCKANTLRPRKTAITMVRGRQSHWAAAWDDISSKIMCAEDTQFIENMFINRCTYVRMVLPT